MDFEEKGDAMTFTDKKPTVPGAYWHKHTKDSDPILIQIVERNGVLMANEGGELLDLALYGGLWSSRLVPVEEVRLAYAEGQRDVYTGDDYGNSRARRLVEGKAGL